ncbi:hypothetical protein ACS8E9_05885 [Pseudomonas neustonica]|uniref:Uncharacterized protein n=1 Tax=Pseudomonas neustonica TaxID=2487346 RepID=A0ABX9XGY0_9PSED|nr:MULTISPECIES: hypothetical protein [Pseudomonas]MBA6420024.1 hypothetical protein [Pseudomonas sp. 5Ae-yellow]ROZ82253.1 hypothetical protein EF099_12905 [Pseudomonas sp. SSM44]ROZ84015.1 hypothetical protein EF096_11260 [Pseudomonas neustonica]
MSIIDSMSQANQPSGLATPSKSSRISTAAEFREIMQSVNQTSEAKQAQAEAKAKEQEENTSTAAEEFSRYMAMSVAEKIKHTLLQEMGLTEEEYDALPPEEKEKIDELIAERLDELNDPNKRASSDELQQQAAERMRAMLDGVNAEKEKSSIFDIT